MLGAIRDVKKKKARGPTGICSGEVGPFVMELSWKPSQEATFGQHRCLIKV